MSARRFTVSMAVVAGAASALFAAAGMAQWAQVWSGWVWWRASNSPRGCRDVYLGAAATDQPQNVLNTGGVEVRQCGSSTPQSLPPGWMGVDVGGWMNGGFCGSGGWFFTTQTASIVTSGGWFCANPAGIQDFHTDTGSLVWNGASYDFDGYQISPIFQK